MPGVYQKGQISRITDIIGGLVFGEPSKWLDTNLKTGPKIGVRSKDWGKDTEAINVLYIYYQKNCLVIEGFLIIIK